jgi:hypothetical protein
MRYFTLKHINAENNLALILNAYMKALSTLDQLTVPRETMGEYMRLLDERSSSQKRETPSSEACTQLFDWRGPRFFMLQVLSNSLNDWHKNINWAIKDLTQFFDQYNGDLKRYAIETRMRVLEEYGSEDDADYNNDDTIKYRDDDDALAGFTLARELDQYFTGSDGSGEKIGTSHASDYTYFTNLVRRESDFCPIKILGQAFDMELPVYKQDVEGEMIEQSLGDQVESELNDDILNAHVVAWFELALEQANHAAGLYCFATTAEHFRELLKHLERLRDLDFPEPQAYMSAQTAA